MYQKTVSGVAKGPGKAAQKKKALKRDNTRFSWGRKAGIILEGFGVSFIAILGGFALNVNM